MLSSVPHEPTDSLIVKIEMCKRTGRCAEILELLFSELVSSGDGKSKESFLSFRKNLERDSAIPPDFQRKIKLQNLLKEILCHQPILLWDLQLSFDDFSFLLQSAARLLNEMFKKIPSADWQLIRNQLKSFFQKLLVISEDLKLWQLFIQSGGEALVGDEERKFFEKLHAEEKGRKDIASEKRKKPQNEFEEVVMGTNWREIQQNVKKFKFDHATEQRILLEKTKILRKMVNRGNASFFFFCWSYF
jgi:hypothetical protein